jgi:hypothetical protein
VPLCGATWPIEEMPRDDVAGFCLAAPRVGYMLAAFWLAAFWLAAFWLAAFWSASLRNWALVGVASP